MNSTRTSLLLTILLVILPVYGQKKALNSITIPDLKSHMYFLASDEMKGRDTGEDELLIAGRYLAVQAEKLGLTAVDPDKDYIQYYTIEEGEYDFENSAISVADESGIQAVNKEHFYLFPAISGESLTITGEVVFAGYGAIDEEYDYDDLEGIDVEDKIVLIMNRAPMNEDGTACQLGSKWMTLQNIQIKMDYLAAMDPKAILVVFDPKSGMNSIEDLNPGIAQYFSKSRQLKKDEEEINEESTETRVALIHRSVADNILAGEGKDLVQLQKEIDATLTPQSFLVEGKTVTVSLKKKFRELAVPNIFGVIEGSDPDLKDEMVIFMAHFDHVGTNEQGGVFNGADDNASGTVALLEIAQAFMAEKKRPARSIGILWVSAEEIGLFGSSYFADHPLVPLDRIAAVINLDMVGRTVTDEDMERGRRGMTIVGKDSVKVIGGKQSSVLMQINEETLDEMGLKPNYTYNDINHPERFYYRSDHINFARKDIPVLFYSTGTHSDYHQVTDTPDRIDYDKFQRMTRFAYKVGYNVANYKGPITVDNPMSEW